MSPRAIAGALMAAAVVVLTVVVFAGGDDRYRVNVELSTANGLREGSEVKVDGVAAGKVHELRLGRGDAVIAELDLDPDDGPIGPGARAEVVTSNLLGSRYVRIDPGDTSRPQASGATIPVSRTDYPVDLDQVLDTLDADTRARLGVLINEAGTALTGRQADFSATLRLLHPSLREGAITLSRLRSDNDSLAATVRRASSFVARLDDERKQLSRAVAEAGTTMQVTADHRADLEKTLQRSPGTLAEAQRFLAELEDVTKPLGPAARAISAAAAPLADVVEQLPAFQRAADPTLVRAAAVAPSLTRLARGATPVLRRAEPAVKTTADFAATLEPVSRLLRVSIDDSLGFLEGWARSIQVRDQLGHVFRGRAAIPVDTFRNAIIRLAAEARPRRKAGGAKGGRPERKVLPKVPDALLPRPPGAGGKPKLPSLKVPAIDLAPAEKVVEDLLGAVTGRQPKSDKAPSSILDDLLEP